MRFMKLLTLSAVVLSSCLPMYVAERKKSPEEVVQLAFTAFLQNDWDTFLKYVDTSTWDSIISDEHDRTTIYKQLLPKAFRDAKSELGTYGEWRIVHSSITSDTSATVIIATDKGRIDIHLRKVDSDWKIVLP